MAYIEKLLKRFGLENVNEKSTPLSEGTRLMKSEKDTSTNKFRQQYQAKVEVYTIW